MTERTTLAGKSLIYRYRSGLETIGRFEAEDRLEWRGIAGAGAGRSGSEKIFVSQPREKLFFVSWVEASGTVVSQVLDLEAMRVTSFVSFEGSGGRMGMLDEGSLEETA
jgi:phenolic acid decarboxylase